MLEKVRATIQKYQLFTGGERIIVGFSGGVDSLCLLHILSGLTDYKIDLWALYINYCLRPAENLREERLLQQVESWWGIKTKSVTVNLPEKLTQKPQSLQLLAREERYRIFKAFRKEINADKIALAHHRDDQVETVLYRIIRGTGIDGLAGIPISRDGVFIRPLLDVSREEIKEYALKHNLVWVEDSSNQKLIYRRNQIRHQLIPAIESSFNRRFKEALLRLAKLAGEQRSFMEEAADLRLSEVILPVDDGKVGIKSEHFLKSHSYLQYYLLKRILSKIAPEHQFESEVLLKLREKICSEAPEFRKIQIAKRVIVYQKEATIFFERRPEPAPIDFQSYSVKLPGISNLSAVNLKLIVEPAEVPQNWNQLKKNEIYVDPLQLKSPVTVRFWRPGDAFRPFGTHGSQKLQDFFVDHKIPRYKRNKIPLLVAEDGRIVWIIGHRFSEEFRVKAGVPVVWHIIAESPSI